MKTQELHSEIGASGMKIWGHCAGSVNASRGLPGTSNAAADEGTRAHAVAEKCMREGPGVRADVYAESPDMADAVQVYLDHAKSLYQRLHAVALVEHKFHLKEIHEAAYGTADLVVMDVAERVLYVRDYKHGKGVVVEVFDEDGPNWQLMYYAAGSLLSNPAWRPTEIDIGIVQPRAPHNDGPIRTHRMPVADLLEFVDFLTAATRATDNPNALRTPGDWCRWCKFAGTPCPELNALTLEIAARMFTPAFSYDAELLADTLMALPMIKSFVKSVHEFAYAEAVAGRFGPPHFKLVSKDGRRKFLDVESAADFFRILGFTENEIFDPAEIKSPAQLEKAVDKGDRAFVNAMVTKVSSGLALVPMSDRRQSATPDALTAFADYIDTEEDDA